MRAFGHVQPRGKVVAVMAGKCETVSWHEMSFGCVPQKTGYASAVSQPASRGRVGACEWVTGAALSFGSFLNIGGGNWCCNGASQKIIPGAINRAHSRVFRLAWQAGLDGVGKS